ncbi:hypothetical protein [Phocicoccus pinnipedialis]|uniref:Membrane domain of glycerophosphoryl diester phosphodiesterase n=1 Tax=Phocicoccus pinnipedialis TaxID=110845 RepID=A0A6V7R3U4_9BACL|nr:hypothetical protein [Jeotgalicoccus pinnipedialis]MBP1939973.1 hypothetical protein [Jeotgalicoccus pinnipedialis]CAD2072079.1 hypothetical protein JEOPIN946_00277 [Jeotgalicoccus pinnipedialis]
MFFFHKDYFRNARGQHLKIFFYGAAMMILALIITALVTLVTFGGGIGLIFGDYIGLGVMTLVFGGLALFVMMVLVLMPLQYSIYAYYMYGYNNADFRFTDGLLLFKKGNFWKSVGIIILLNIMFFVLSGVIYGVIYGTGFAIASLFGVGSAMFNPDAAEALGVGAMGVLIVIQFGLAFIQMAVYLLAQIAISMIMLNHIDQPQTSLGSKLAKGLTIAFKSMKDLIKLLLSNFILIAIPVILHFVAIIVIGISGLSLGSPDSLVFPVGVAISMGVVGVVFMIMYIFIGYYMIGSYISYYFNGRDAYEAKYETPNDNNYGPEDTQHITIS